MKHYKDPITNEVYAYEADGSQDAFIKEGLVAITDAEAEAVRVAAAETITETENAALAYTEDQSSPNGASAPVLNEIAPKPAKKLAKLTPPLPPKRH